ncbi:malonate decarboxylase subunit epsilon [Trinickia caryophylli]|uniref:Malonyl CoA-acyl carrier protein transacylase n=1 Tax=Trinickia caryophylli TaxID=28094 RepID=A0A1X7CVM0_TRICW|nr:malonate decarboxylase subunit epsilon [Trinickia caryophylli]PMS13605.1 malonate decarboxylase subunit epsilon [Trinickia caryophylli]TRX15320.1 malonate decarboxylase subunit epsilon [Trinickia caryophylli]WQE15667.1 malonate decarboxylase subunit epsilon [Trinickia caryophylli]SMF03992.1 malonate decarboxylase epsilon subunit [Trinickia caryophylli]GLU30937.1 malonyl CoA-acyl carrier protein transacylase [Trinickia caryophylli]
MLACLFPGQGAQSPEFLHRLPHRAAVRATLEEASDALGVDVMTLDTADALRSSVAVQIALVVAGVATARRLEDEGFELALTAGLSVGAYAAAVTSGALAFADGLRLVRRRAQLMETAYPSGYGLAAIEGLNEHEVETLADALASEEGKRVYVGNVNAPRQIVVAGANDALERFGERALAAGAHRAKRLDVSVPSHCELLAQAADELSAFARELTFRAPRAVYVANRNARALRTGDAVREDLVTNMRYTVRWFDSLTALVEMGATVFVEVPPGQVLTSIAQVSYPEIPALSACAIPDERLIPLLRKRLAPGQ